MASSGHRTSILLRLVRENPNEREVKNELFKVVQARLRAIASGYLRQEHVGHSLQTTVLVDDAFLKLVKSKQHRDVKHFFLAACGIVQDLLIDHARRKKAIKRGRGDRPAEIGKISEPQERRVADAFDQLKLKDALARLNSHSPDAYEVFCLKYFGGYEHSEIADNVLQIPIARVKKRWREAQEFLRNELEEGVPNHE